MAIAVEIEDRLYDYTDEEKASDAVASFQLSSGLNDDAVIEIWASKNNSLRDKLERAIFDAVDLNGSAKRARYAVPGSVVLFVQSEQS